jgi:hypothetical protein
MNLNDIRRGQRLWWQRPSRDHGPFYQAARVLRTTPSRVIVLVRMPYGPARRSARPEYLFSKIPLKGKDTNR